MIWPNKNKIPEYLPLPEDHPLTVKIRKIDSLIKELSLDFQFSKGEFEHLNLVTGVYLLFDASVWNF
jgi:hypothetical protein